MDISWQERLVRAGPVEPRPEAPSIVWVSATYADAGGPYDAGLVEDFRKSGAHDLTTYAVGDTTQGEGRCGTDFPQVALELSGQLGGGYQAFSLNQTGAPHQLNAMAICARVGG